MTRYTDIIARLEAATGPDRELDRSIGLAAGLLHLDQDGRLYRIDTDDGGWVHGGLSDDILIRGYTASIDATVALIERVLPGWSYEIRKSGFGNGQAAVWNPMKQPGHGNTIRADHNSSPALALLLALFRALEAQEAV